MRSLTQRPESIRTRYARYSTGPTEHRPGQVLGQTRCRAKLAGLGSLSITLASLWTRTTVEFSKDLLKDEFSLNGERQPAMSGRVSKCLDSLPLFTGPRPAARVTSECNFPVAAGLASSASAFAALVHAACAAAGANLERQSLARLAGQASGSAARSLYGGIVELVAWPRTCMLSKT